MDTGMQDLNSEMRKIKLTKSEQIDDFAKKEGELEMEIAELCEEVTTYRRMADDRGKELSTLKVSNRDINKKMHDQSNYHNKNGANLEEEIKDLENDNRELLKEIQNFKNMLNDSENVQYSKNLGMVSLKKEFTTEKKKLEEEIDKLKAQMLEKECVNNTPDKGDPDSPDGYNNLLDSFQIEPTKNSFLESNYNTQMTDTKGRGDPKYTRET